MIPPEALPWLAIAAFAVIFAIAVRVIRGQK